MQGVRAAVIACALLALGAAPAAAGSGGAGLGGAPRAHHGHGHRAHHHRHHHHRRRPAAPPNPLARRAMWIWELGSVDGGDVPAIVADTRRYGIGTLLIKSSDGTDLWSQFGSQLVSELHAAGLKVCAWQYVYGNHPITEAYVGAAAVRDGADCLVIDAESEYEGRYVAAQAYLQRLRRLIGPRFPVALAGFPYVDFHPAFPYSVFLGPGGAQFDAPQMYWRDIGSTTDSVFAHTYSYNLPYGRPIFPLGQVYGNPPAHQIVRFRQLSRAYGAGGVSWWDWQEARPYSWTAISRPTGQLPGYTPFNTFADVAYGTQGDMVVWIQEHLISAGWPVAVTGYFGPHTQAAVQAFQTAHGLAVDGIVGQDTWTALLRYRPVAVTWVNAAGGDSATVASARRVGPLRAPVPRSASLPARRDELAGAGGAGRPPRH